MSPGRVGLAAIVVAIAAAALVVPPARARGAAAESETRRVSAELSEIRSRLAEAERRRGARALALEEGSVAVEGEVLTALRGAVVDALAGLDLSRVRLSVAPATTPAAASLSLRAQGNQGELLRLLDRLAHPTGSLVLDDVALRPAGDDALALDLTGFILRGSP